MPKILFKWKDIESAEKYYRGKDWSKEVMDHKIRLDMLYGTKADIDDIEAFEYLFSIKVLNNNVT